MDLALAGSKSPVSSCLKDFWPNHYIPLSFRFDIYKTRTTIWTSIVKSLHFSFPYRKVLWESHIISIIIIVIYYYYSYAVPPPLWTPYTWTSIFLEHKWLGCLLNLLSLIPATFPLLQRHLLNCDSNHLDEEQSSGCHHIQLSWWVSAYLWLQLCDSIPAGPHKSGSAWTCTSHVGPPSLRWEWNFCICSFITHFYIVYLLSFDTKFSLEA